MMELLEYCDITDRPSYLKWCLTHHPDKGGDAKKFALVKSAYENHIRTPLYKERDEDLPPNIEPWVDIVMMFSSAYQAWKEAQPGSE